MVHSGLSTEQSSDSDVGTQCHKPAVATRADCRSAICSACCMECCGQSFCVVCGDYHATHFCVRKPVQSNANARSSPDKA